MPPVSRTTAWDADRAASRIDELRQLPGAILPILHALQAEFGYVDQAAVPLIAEALNLSRAEVHGIVSFYHDFRNAPPGTPCAEALPRRGLPVDGGRCARSRSAQAASGRLGRHHRPTAA